MRDDCEAAGYGTNDTLSEKILRELSQGFPLAGEFAKKEMQANATTTAWFVASLRDAGGGCA